VWNPVKELKVSPPCRSRGLDAPQLVESGEGIEREPHQAHFRGICEKWNPVKELKVIGSEPSGIRVITKWNPVKELKVP